MAVNEYPRLCGGTFFTLLLQARKQRTKAREHRKGERDGLADTDVLVGLLKVFNPDYLEPTASTMSTFKTNTSDFKSCKISNSMYLPFEDTAAFDSRVINKYAAPLGAMYEFVDRFIDVGASAEKDIRLVKALLELIDADQSIDNEQVFYFCEDGSPRTKGSLRGETRICLPSFLLAVWHFVLVNRKINTVGRTTYDRWCPPNRGAERKYAGSMGDSITRPIYVTRIAPVDLTKNAAAKFEDGRSEKDCDPCVDVTSEIKSEKDINQACSVENLNTDYYNLFVINTETFESGRFLVPKDRALTEKITPEIAEQFAGLSDESIAQIKTFPSIFASENHFYGRTDDEHNARFGVVTDVKVQENGVKIYFNTISFLPQQRLNELAFNLALASAYSLNRTYWTIKKINLLEELADAGIQVLGPNVP